MFTKWRRILRWPAGHDRARSRVYMTCLMIVTNVIYLNLSPETGSNWLWPVGAGFSKIPKSFRTHSKIPNLMIVELFYSDTEVPFIFTRRFRRIHFSVSRLSTFPFPGLSRNGPRAIMTFFFWKALFYNVTFFFDFFVQTAKTLSRFIMPNLVNMLHNRSVASSWKYAWDPKLATFYKCMPGGPSF